ncbi:unnamed protein product [Moneuplotes crassus]|uniref:AP2/ERF domain-containing protein n=1 Tax=Euplotes crassus TaxID=5936 RepID=A0AAD1XY90_EUPCR|nr:unnamed protein product [Moneuplotes crassus]
MAQYCWECHIPATMPLNTISSCSLADRKPSLTSSSLFGETQKSVSVEHQSMRSSKRPLPDISSTLSSILEMTESPKGIFFKASPKSSRGLHNGTSTRRSRFVGVLGNGKRWQVLINVSGKKRYIGTYSSEREAALVHDCYSIGLNGLRAKTNFDYDSAALKEMIGNYFTNDCCFKAAEFMNRV